MQPLSAPVLGATRYAIEILVTVAGSATALPLAHFGGIYPLGVVVALLAVALWAVGRVGPNPRGDQNSVASWVAFGLGTIPIARDNAP